MRVDFLNFTNGLERIHEIENPHFIRIQSTACEQKRWKFILEELDYDFLFHVAKGDEVYIHDLSARKPYARALYQGIPFINYSLHYYWEDIFLDKCFVKSNNVAKYFKEVVSKIPIPTNIKYIKRFYKGPIQIIPVGGRTLNDGNDLYFRSLLK
jgi:hypothetical protein